MSTQHGVKVGILADSNAAIAEIRQLFINSVHSIEFARAVSPELSFEDLDAEVWVFASQDCDEQVYDAFSDYVDAERLPVIYDDFSYLTPQNRAAHALSLEQKISACNERCQTRVRAREVWVLAASAGGPEALGEFFSTLNKKADGQFDKTEGLLDTAFVIAQHIAPEALPSLVSTLERASGLKVNVCDRAHQLCGASIYLVHPELQVEFNDYGTVTPVNIPWQGAFSPTIDQVMARVARAYRERSGTIIFSGMSDDGAASCRYLSTLGGVVWAQSPESCAVNSMPVSAIKTRYVAFSATPQALAEQFPGRHASQRFMFKQNSLQGHA